MIVYSFGLRCFFFIWQLPVLLQKRWVIGTTRILRCPADCAKRRPGCHAKCTYGKLAEIYNAAVRKRAKKERKYTIYATNDTERRIIKRL
jgi:hypothetical protein